VVRIAPCQRIRGHGEVDVRVLGEEVNKERTVAQHVRARVLAVHAARSRLLGVHHTVILPGGRGRKVDGLA
jgi:hypothetical protein